MTMFRRSPDKKLLLKKNLEYHWSQMAYVKNTKRLNRMREYLLAAQLHLDNNELTEGFDALYLAKREFILARTKGQIYYHRSSRGMFLATVLVIIFSLGLLGLWLLQDESISNIAPSLQVSELESITFTIAPFLAALGGGIGGCAAVLIQAIDVDPESEVVSKSLWYTIKPVLGAGLGLVTYFAVVSGLNVVADGAKVDNFAGAVVIGFLAGFFESFSSGVLARIAGQFTPVSKSEDAEEEKNSRATLSNIDEEQQDSESLEVGSSQPPD